MNKHAYELKMSNGHATVWVGPYNKLIPHRRFADLFELSIAAKSKGCKGFKVEALTADLEELAAGVRLALTVLLKV